MIFSHRTYFTILIHILLILATAGLGLWMIASHSGYIIGGILSLCSLLQIGALTRQLNKFNRKIKLFFDAIQDRDTMHCFPEKSMDKEQEQLNRSLNRINNLLIQTKTEKKKQEHNFEKAAEYKT